MKVIGLSGKAGSGKDFIHQKYLKPRGWYQFSMAWHFKVWLVAAGRFSHDDVFHIKPPEVRRTLQVAGTELGRDVYGYDIWLRVIEEWFILLGELWGIDKFVIPDIRFINERDFIQNKLGGYVIRVVAPSREQQSGLDQLARQHASESEMDLMSDDEFNAIIVNEPNVDVEKEVENALEWIGYEY
jgi:hypothetical protein